MLIAQMSDFHVAAPGQLVYGRVDTRQMLSQAVKAVRSLPRQPDLILATGDLVNSGKPEEYAAALEILHELEIPVFPVAGNHDDREALSRAFDLSARLSAQPGFVQYVIEGWPLRIVVIDTITPHSNEPSMCGDRLAWVRARLQESDQPTLIAMHHLPVSTGVAWMEPKNMDWAKPLAEIIAGNPAVVRVVCGHVHRPMTAMWAGACTTTAPSTCYQVYPDVTAHAAPRFDMESPGFVLHRWEGTTLISFNISIPGLEDTFNPRCK